MAVKTLVVPLDGSEFAERALGVAQTLAERIGARLLLISAQYSGHLEPGQYLEAHAIRCDRCPVDVIATNEAAAAEAIVEAIEGDDGRMVCMTTHGRGRLRWAALGSVAEDVIRHAGRPMFLVGRNCRADFLERSSHLVVCTDGGGGSHELAPAAREWSELLGLDLRVGVVVHPLDVESAEHAEGLLGSIAAQFDGEAVAPTMITSDYPAGALADFADELPAAIVAMSCHGRAGLARLALGSMTMGVLHLASCPLLVTHREDEAALEHQTRTR
ncbi:MAG: universal stress protein [Acidimicrobiia bacterium]